MGRWEFIYIQKRDEQDTDNGVNTILLIKIA